MAQTSGWQRLAAALGAGMLLSCCRAPDAPTARGLAWCDVVAEHPDDFVTDRAMRRRLEASGLPWKVRDRATGVEMVLVLPGEFVMGSPADEAGREAHEGPAHRVRLTRPFYLGVGEVTQAQWRRVMGEHRSFFPGNVRPVESVGWQTVQRFLLAANARTEEPEAPPLRLPTEAEWEYACRAGAPGPFAFEAEIGHDLVNFRDGVPEHARVVDGRLEVTWREPPTPQCRMTTAPCGSLPPNAWGLCEMHGNLWEWCADAYVPGAYEGRGALAVDPFVPPERSALRSLRGGSWYDAPARCRSAARDAGGLDVPSNRIGFRVARSL